jgi:phosphate-selective porin OprO/OprP
MKSLLVGAALTAVLSGGAFAQAPVFNGAPEWVDPETGNSFKLRGRLFLDAAAVEVDLDARDESYTDTEIRTGRLGVEGEWYGFGYKAEWDFAGDEVTAKDVYISREIGAFDVWIGNQKTPNSLEEQTSSRYTTFMERGQATDAFRLDRRIGVTVGTGGDRYSFRGGVFGGDVSEDADGASESHALAARFTAAPINTDAAVLHLGASTRYYSREDTGPAIRIRSRPNVHLAQRLVAASTAAEESTLYGLEAAWISGPFHAHAEYMTEDVDGVAEDFEGYFVNLGWFITGEQRAYRASSGTFRRTSPNAPLSMQGLGAWEVAGRYDVLDAGSGGEMATYTLGLNWYPESHVRFMVNAVVAEVDGSGAAFGEGDFAAVQARVQIDW